MKLTFVGAAHEVTGSCHFLQAAGKNILIDCGMEQGPDLYENPGLPIPENEIDYVFLTHAHIDHSGMLPKLAKNGFKGQIFTTLQLPIYVISCFVTALIFRSLRQNGETGKAEGQENRNLSPCM